MANFDVGIFAGHGTSEVDGSYDCGAVSGSKQEHIIAEKIAVAARDLLKGSGYNVHYDEQNYKDNDSKNNSYRMKYIISIHINAGGGRGSEVLVPINETDFNLESEILSGLTKLGLANRGLKSREYTSEKWHQRTNGVKVGGKDYYKEIREAWTNGVSLSILEVGFIDSSDITIIENNISKIAWIIASAIAKADGKVLAAATPEASETYYRVVCGSFKDKTNAEIRMNELKKFGFEAFIQAYKK